MANLSTFPARANVEATDQFVGYRAATSGGEGRWTAATLQAWVQAFTTKSSIGLGSVDNTADSAKPVSTAQAAAISAAQASAIASASADATTKANAAQSAAISTASSDATTKANAAQSAAASDATTKANAAQSAAISTAASDATTKANAAQSAAISTAATDATTKANAAQAAAIASAASDATTKANAAQAAAIAASQPLDADLTAIAALTTTSFGRTFLTLADAAATRSALGLVIDSNVQSYSARLAAIAGLSTAADTLPYFTGASTAALATFTSTGRTLVAAADAAAGRSALGLVIGTHVQAYSGALATYAAIPPSANVQGFLAAADYAAMRTALGAGAASGLSTLDAGGKIPTAQIPDAVLGQVKFQGTWNAATNTPTLSGTPAATTKGDYYIVSTGGTQFSKTFEVGDWIISNGATQDKIDNTDAVTTVAGRIGNVTLTASDLTDGTAAGRTLFTAANAAAQRTALALVVGTDVQAYSANLAALAGITSAADRLPYFTGSGTATYANFTSYGRTLAALVDAAAGRTALGLGTLATQSGTFSGSSSGTNTGDQTTISGNAGTATALATSRTIGGSSFNGTANITSFPAPGPIGGTTPSTGAFTTLSASGPILAQSNGAFIYTPNFGTLSGFVQITNTGGNYLFGVDNSGGGAIGFGNAYEAGISVPAGRGISQAIVGTGVVTRTTATGVAVTGALSATGADNTVQGRFEGATGKLRIIGYASAITGTLLQAINPAENSYAVPLTLDGGSLRGAVSGVMVTNTTSSGFAVTGQIGNSFTGANGQYALSSDNTSSANFHVFYNSASVAIGSINRVTTTNAVAYNTTSDRRIKENFGLLTESGRLIDSLTPRTFDRKDGTDSDRKGWLGFVAQEVYAADPVFARIGFVTVGDDDPTEVKKTWGVSSSPIDAIVVAELKSLRARVAQLEAA